MSEQGKKKRLMEGDHRRKEDVLSDDDDNELPTGGIKVFADGSTFERASEAELATRKIYKRKPRNPQATSPPTTTTTTPTTNNTAATTTTPVAPSTTSVPAATSSNPFASFSFQVPTTTTPTPAPPTSAPAASSNPFANFSFNLKPAATTAPTTTAVEEKKSESNIWKCACCETENDVSKNTCSVCMVPRLVKDDKKTTTTTEAPKIDASSLFSAKPSSTIDASSLFSAKPTSTSTTNPSLNPFALFSSNTSSSASINAASLFSTPGTKIETTATAAVEEKKSESNIWKCACCETENDVSKKTCSICMVPRLVKDDKKTATTTEAPKIDASSLFSAKPSSTIDASSLFSAKPASTSTTTNPSLNPFALFSSTSAPINPASLFSTPGTKIETTTAVEEKKTDSNIWKCACCETENDISKKTCSICMVPRLIK